MARSFGGCGAIRELRLCLMYPDNSVFVYIY